MSRSTLTAAARRVAEPVDDRLTPAYYLQGIGPGPVAQILRGCASVFDIKAAVALALDDPESAGLLPAGGGVIESGADVHGRVIVQKGARIEAGARVVGPVLVCSGSVICAGALVRDHTIVGPDCAVGFGAEITRSFLAGGCSMKHPSFVGDSVLGWGVNLGAFATTTGLRCDGGPVTEPATKPIEVTLDGRRINTGQTKFGAMIGDGVALPAGTVLAPGTLIGPGTVIYPRTLVGGVLPTGSRVR
ncbi:hypothetical protein FM076_08550 [Streptomyces albus subsp. chlorinus]|uniref:hypothetical protein n=1 Tax=Streptomyces albus TaxID=1888 RepID=UPI00156F9ED4|nr:hypothetical protein [Streptomyces albus]NSC21255.1 hypothetical protein [Streptomyces albus subsp. chlorinus]